MPSASFVKQKSVGTWFEDLLDPVLVGMGFKVYSSDHLKYRDKKGWDKELEIKGVRSKVELKYDAMSEQTGNVAIDLDSIEKSISAIWIYGLPEGNQIHVYTMFLSDLAPYALQWPIKRLGGEWASPIALIPKATFLGQDWVKKIKTIQL